MIGHRINPVTMKPERILKLEEAYLAQLKEALQEKMISLAPKKTFPVCKYDKKGLTAFDKIN
jgi:hypothetical protein